MLPMFMHGMHALPETHNPCHHRLRLKLSLSFVKQPYSFFNGASKVILVPFSAWD
jgi:hypothetical protein